jgi:hypothetical protein
LVISEQGERRMPIDVHGTVAEGFEGVREEFAAVLAAERDDPGAQLVVYRHGRRVVDLWGRRHRRGVADDPVLHRQGSRTQNGRLAQSVLRAADAL